MNNIQVECEYCKNKHKIIKDIEEDLVKIKEINEKLTTILNNIKNNLNNESIFDNIINSIFNLFSLKKI